MGMDRVRTSECSTKADGVPGGGGPVGLDPTLRAEGEFGSVHHGGIHRGPGGRLAFRAVGVGWVGLVGGGLVGVDHRRLIIDGVVGPGSEHRIDPPERVPEQPVIGAAERGLPAPDGRMGEAGAVAGQAVLEDEGVEGVLVVDEAMIGVELEPLEDEEIGVADGLAFVLATVEAEAGAGAPVAAAGGAVVEEPGVMDALPEQVHGVGL